MADINIEDVTNTAETGIFDKLMYAVNKQIEKQYLESRITASDYANVYLGSLQAVLAQSIQYGLQEQVTEAQISSIEADNLLKEKQLEIANKDLEIKSYELENLLPKQSEKLSEEIESANKQQELADQQIKTAYSDRVVKDKQAAKLGLDNVMKNAELEKLNNSSAVYTPKYEEL